MKQAWYRDKLIPGLTLATLAALPLAAWSADLDLEVDNVKGAGGDLRVGVYASAGEYRKTAIKEVKAAADGSPVAIRISGLAPGDYAIALYHDRNRNEKLDTNLLGIPTEPYGFSGSARNLMGPATWEQAKFSVAAEGATVTVTLSD